MFDRIVTLTGRNSVMEGLRQDMSNCGDDTAWPWRLCPSWLAPQGGHAWFRTFPIIFVIRGVAMCPVFGDFRGLYHL